jgi:hypothetical protein
MRPKIIDRGSRIAIRLEASDREMLEQKAKKKDVTLSKLLRGIIKRYVRRTRLDF